MALPVIGYLGWIAIVAIAGVGGFSIYQIRLAVKDVTEVFTEPESVLNGVAFQALAGAAVVYIAVRFLK